MHMQVENKFYLAAFDVNGSRFYFSLSFFVLLDSSFSSSITLLVLIDESIWILAALGIEVHKEAS